MISQYVFSFNNYYNNANIVPMAAVIPPPVAVVVRAPVIPQEVNVEKRDPAATFPIVACVAAARLPAATPAAPNPNNVAPNPPAAANEPPIIKRDAIFYL